MTKTALLGKSTDLNKKINITKGGFFKNENYLKRK